MAKKKNKTKSLIWFILALLFGVLSVCAFFLPFANVNISSETIAAKTEGAFSGFAEAFGGKVKMTLTQNVFGSGTYVQEGNTTVVPLAQLSFILLTLGILGTVVAKLIEKSYVKAFTILNVVVIIAGVVFAFTSYSSLLQVNGISENIQEYYSIGIGAILAGVFGTLSATSNIINVF